MSRFAIAAAAIAMMIAFSYRAWLIRSEASDLSAYKSKGDTIVRIAGEDWKGSYGSFNMVCSQGEPDHILISWRMPCHSYKERCPYLSSLPKDWHTITAADGGSSSPKDSHKAVALSAKDLLGSSVEVELGEFVIVRRTYGEVLVSKPVSAETWARFLTGLKNFGAKFRIAIDNQTGTFVNDLDSSRVRTMAQLCRRQQ